MTLWIFGDSYAQTSEKVNNSWIQQISQELGTDLKDLSHFGSALEFSYYRFNIARKKIAENDTVIITLTDSSHRWFFRHFPAAAVARHSPQNNKQETKAIELYYQYLEHKEIQEIYLIDFLYNVTELTEKKNLKVIIIPVFEDTEKFLENRKDQFPLLTIATGKLYDISFNEIDPFFSIKFPRWTINGSDIRLNHICKSNHSILKDKVIDNIKNNTPLDLKSNFVTNIIDEDTLKDNTFIEQELFGCLVKSL